MRTVKPGRLILLSVLLLVIVLLLNGTTGKSRAVSVKEPLNRYFTLIQGWSAGESTPLSQTVQETLFLDDHIMKTFSRGTDRVTLYVGYYRTAAKVGSAHHPLVCFTGQGWSVGGTDRGTYRLASAPLRISYSSMIAERNMEKELVLYWFQTNSSTSSGTFCQKVDMVKERVRGASEDSAFVRLSTPLGDESPEAARQRIFTFIETFYPAFHRYVTKG